ncbi:MAG: tetratricopeptide (TPR) repeat protein [Saprospiraceae bacterium]|jgi:tetratricopeptide (TPR) repeat protein
MFLKLEEAINLGPFNQKALEPIRIAVEMEGKYKESLNIHYAVINENPYAHQAWYNLSHAHYSLRKYEDALSTFEYAFIIDKWFEPAYIEYVGVCFHLNLYNKALDSLKQAVLLFQEDSEMLLKMGICYEYLEDYATARTYLFKALVQNHQEDEIYFYIAECYAKGINEALEVLEKGEEHSYGADLLYCKSALLFKIGERTIAFQYLEEALLENYEKRDLFLNLIPEMKTDKDINGIIRYFRN